MSARNVGKVLAILNQQTNVFSFHFTMTITVNYSEALVMRKWQGMDHDIILK